MSIAKLEPSSTPTPPSPSPAAGPATKVLIRIIYRDGRGEIHLDWPLDRIRECLDDAKGTAWVDVLDPEANAGREAEHLLTEVFRFHPLAVEDALQETQIPKVDDWGDYIYVVFNSIDFDAQSHKVRLHELDVFLGRNYLVTYHNEPLKFLDQDRRNIERDPSLRLKQGADHLLYTLLDEAISECLPAIEKLDDSIDEAQEEVFDSPTPATLQAIFQVKRSVMKIHRTLSPQREVLNRLARDVYEPISQAHRVYFRDAYDHTVRVHELNDSLRDLVSGALDTYLSAISNRTNDIMKRLTLVTVMFLPMTFLTGFFGMNFFGETLAFTRALPRDFLFSTTCLAMAGSFFGQLVWAWRRGWFTKSDAE